MRGRCTRWLTLMLVAALPGVVFWVWAQLTGHWVGFGTTFPAYIKSLVPMFCMGLGLRMLIAVARDRSLGGVLRLLRPALLLDLLAILAVIALLTDSYTWVKIYIPALNPRLWDAELAKLDLILGFGLDLNTFFLAVIAGAPRWIQKSFDSYYAIYLPSVLASLAWFSTRPGHRERFGFIASFCAVWIIGIIGYVTFPSVGPVFVVEELFGEVRPVFQIASYMQLELIRNYEIVRLGLEGELVSFNPKYGVAAMPSLHVAVHAFLWSWSRRVGDPLSHVFLAMTLLTWMTSVATGWHWAADGLVGIGFAVPVAGLGYRWLVQPFEVLSRRPEVEESGAV